MKHIVAITFLVSLSLLEGCAAKHEFTRLQGSSPTKVCILRHEAIKEGVLEAIQEGLTRRNISSSVVTGIYEEKHGLVWPRWYPDQVTACDALCTYYARWTWDIATYMYFANVKLISVDGTKVLAEATYQSRGGPDKWINARNKILELVDGMLAGYTAPAATSSPTATEPSTAARLEQLEELRKRKLISEEEYKRKRQEILGGV